MVIGFFIILKMMDAQKDVENIKSLDEMAKVFFRIGRCIGHPLKKIDLELTESWGEQTKLYTRK